MFTKIVVPLDGSNLAEEALPEAMKLAVWLDAQLLLVRIAELPHLADDTFELELELITKAETYLGEVKQTLAGPATVFQLPPGRIQTQVALGRAASQLTELISRNKADLVIMTTHGRSGLARLAMGSVASEVIQHSTVPVVLISPDHTPKTETENQKAVQEPISLGRRAGPLLVPLDGTAKGEAALELATALARQLKTSLHLFEVVEPVIPVQYPEMATTFTSDLFIAEDATKSRCDTASEYLNELQQTICAKGINCAIEVRRGLPTQEITGYAREIQAALLIMATHARGRIGQVLLGSVAEEVMRKTHIPVMMVRVPHLSRKKDEDK